MEQRRHPKDVSGSSGLCLAVLLDTHILIFLTSNAKARVFLLGGVLRLYGVLDAAPCDVRATPILATALSMGVLCY